MIGRNTPRVDSRAKMRGAPLYTADITYEGMLHAAVVRAPLAHGRIRAIRRGDGVDWSRVTFATAGDVPGQRTVQMIAADMPLLAWDEVLYRGEPVALVAAPTLEEAEAARRAVTVEMDPLPAVLTLEAIVERHLRGDPDLTTLSRWTIREGDAEAALAGAEVVVEDTYTTPHQEQAYLETNAMTAIPEPDGRMRVEGSLQCPYYVAPAVGRILGDEGRVHVRALPMGGAFGGKEDFPSLMGGHVALLAHLSGKPVRMVLSRAEDLAFTTKRHPSWTRVRAGARRDGSLVAVVIDTVFDGGAYVTMSPVVLSRGAIHAPGGYRWPHVLVTAAAYRTHTPPNGAFRGFGVPQTIFAVESHIDRLAAACGLEPHEFRLKNRLRLGDTTGTGQVLRESVGSEEVLRTVLEKSDYEAKRRAWGRDAVRPGERTARGVGLSYFWHGAGFTGGGEAKIAARVALDLADDGRAHVRAAATEMGQGAHTVLPQIAAEALGVSASVDAVMDRVDTGEVPNSGPTVASRTTMIVGGEVHRCAKEARRWLLDQVAVARELERDTLSLQNSVVTSGDAEVGRFGDLVREVLGRAGVKRRTFEAQHELAGHLRWDEASHRGDAYACYAWGAAVAEVEVDLETCEVRVPRVTVAVDIGRAVNPVLARGQVEGGTLQSLGYALCEEVGVRPDGGLLRDRFQTYIVPTTQDAPVIDTHLVEVPYSRGPGGAKGLGEMPMNGGAPAVAGALEHALGVRIRDLPLSPERIFMALNNKNCNNCNTSGGEGDHEQ